MEILPITIYKKQQNNSISVVLNACTNKRKTQAKNEPTNHSLEEVSERNSTINFKSKNNQSPGTRFWVPEASCWTAAPEVPWSRRHLHLASGGEKKTQGKQSPLLRTLAQRGHKHIFPHVSDNSYVLLLATSHEC